MIGYEKSVRMSIRAFHLKKLVLAAAAYCFMTVPGQAQEESPAGYMAYFIALYTLGPAWDKNKPAHEQEYFSEHSAHLLALRKEKKIRLGARYAETGMIVLRARSEAEAREWLEPDPAVRNKLFRLEVFEMSPFYKGCLD
jgi:hypothetical protein